MQSWTGRSDVRPRQVAIGSKLVKRGMRENREILATSVEVPHSSTYEGRELKGSSLWTTLRDDGPGPFDPPRDEL